MMVMYVVAYRMWDLRAITVAVQAWVSACRLGAIGMMSTCIQHSSLLAPAVAPAAASYDMEILIRCIQSCHLSPRDNLISVQCNHLEF